MERTLDVGSEVRVITPREGGWSKPSLDPAREETPGEFGLVTFGILKAANPAARLEGRPERYSDRGPPYTDRDRVSQLVLRVQDAPLSPGDTFEVVFPQARVSRLAPHLDPTRNVTGYRIQVKPRGAEEWQEVEGLPRYQIVPLAPQGLVVRTPSRVVRDEPFDAAIHVQDQFQNPVPTFQGRVILKSTDPAALLPDGVFFRPEDRGVIRVEGLRLRTPGVHTLTVTSGTDLPRGSALSTPIEVLAEKPALRLYWGEMHCHGALSYDARNWSGCTMRPADMYWYARSIQNLDFAAVTDHSMHSNRLTQQNMTEPEFREIQAAARAHNRDGDFVTF
ncbi:MAG: DUF3604 domain-containing protein, partial [Armatimonadota bacterium]|nr:DUF3604 domain-containing protein [Armatimonadota bacterium]